MTKGQKARLFAAIGTLPLLAVFLFPSPTSAAGPTINAGSTTTFGILAATTITNTGHTTVGGTAGGDIGLTPGTSFPDSSTVMTSGSLHIADAVATTAKGDLVTAYNSVAAPTPTVLATPELSSQVLTPGTYSTGAGNFTNSGTLTLDAKGDPNAVFIFQAASTLTTSAGSQMKLVNGAQASNVYWNVGSSATLGANSTFVGHLYALTSITANNGASIEGQLLSQTGAVNLNANTITNTAFVAPATLTVVKHVVNAYGGTAAASDFMIHVTHNGSEVAGSPVAGADGAGVTFTLEPGTYLVTEDHHDGYYGTFGSTDPALGNSVSTGLITLTSGQTATITRTNYQIAPAYVPTPTPTGSSGTPAPTPTGSSGTPTTTTQSGGTLPKTGSPWYNLLALAGGLVLLGGIGLGTKKALR